MLPSTETRPTDFQHVKVTPTGSDDMGIRYVNIRLWY